MRRKQTIRTKNVIQKYFFSQNEVDVNGGVILEGKKVPTGTNQKHN